jgi:hypothetical protein
MQKSTSALSARAAGSILTENWAGATKVAKDIKEVVGTVKIPTWTNRADGFTSGMYLGVRLDGFPDCQTDSPMAGIIQATGGYNPWGDVARDNFLASWAWGDDSGGSSNQVDFPMLPGDEIKIGLYVLSPTSINGTVTNLRTGQTEYRIMGNQNNVCAGRADWVTGAYTSMGKPMPFTNFTEPVIWTDASATTAGGEAVNLEGSQLMDIDATWTKPLNGGLMTDCNLVSSSSLSCARLYPQAPADIAATN